MGNRWSRWIDLPCIGRRLEGNIPITHVVEDTPVTPRSVTSHDVPDPAALANKRHAVRGLRRGPGRGLLHQQPAQKASGLAAVQGLLRGADDARAGGVTSTGGEPAVDRSRRRERTLQRKSGRQRTPQRKARLRRKFARRRRVRKTRPHTGEAAAKNRCSRCGRKHCCSRRCQKKDWKEGGHKLSCNDPPGCTIRLEGAGRTRCRSAAVRVCLPPGRLASARGLQGEGLGGGAPGRRLERSVGREPDVRAVPHRRDAAGPGARARAVDEAARAGRRRPSDSVNARSNLASPGSGAV